MSNLIRDLRFGLRTAAKSPGYSLIVIGTLALAIGANTLLFSIVNPLVIRGVPLLEPSTLGWVLETNHRAGVERSNVSMPDFLEWRAQAKSFSALGGRDTRSVTLSGSGDAERVQIVRATANLQDIWGLHPEMGRLFKPGEDTPGAPGVAVLSHRYWSQKFHGDPAAIGQVVFLDGAPVTIVGVMEQKLEVGGYSKSDLWTMLPLDPSKPRDDRQIRIIGRLAPGVSLQSASAEIAALAAAQARAHPETNADWQAEVVSTNTAITTPETWVLLGLLGVIVLFVLLIACANLANLVMTRLLRHRHDLAVRLALGATRVQVVRPLLFESLLLSIAGGIGGLGVAHAGLRIINATAYDQLLKQVGIDGNVLIFTAALSLLTPILFSLAPAINAGRSGTAETLRSARSSGGRPARRRRHVLVGGQVALALSLLIVSGLVLRTTFNYQHLNTGLDATGVLCFTVNPPSTSYADDASRARLSRDLAGRVSKIPGVTGAAVVSHVPVLDTEVMRTVTGTRHDGDNDEHRPSASWYAATPDFFRVAGIGLVAGRGFEATDLATSQPVAILSRIAAEQFFDSVGDSLGQTIVIRSGASTRPVTIVGVVADTRNSQLKSSYPQVYVPFEQWPVAQWTVLLKSLSPAERSQDVRPVMRELDPAAAVSAPKTVQTLVDEANGDTGIVNGLFLGFAVLALMLAAAGLYGVISHSVGQRQREIGVRLALGAAPQAIRRQVVLESLRVTGTGMAVGLVLAVLFGQASASVLFGVSPTDPATFGTMLLLVAFVSVAAVWAPATRAMKVDPARTLRAE